MPTSRFKPGDSPIHTLDARAKLLCLLLLLTTVVGTRTMYGYALVLAVIWVILITAKLPLRLTVGPMRRLWPFFAFILVMNALFFTTTETLWSWWIFSISLAGMWQGFSVVAHVVLIIVLGNVLTLTTTPIDVTRALESLIKPLQLIGVPTADVAMIISVAVQFIPILLEEADMIKKAQIARGAQFESQKLSERTASFLPLIVPIFLAAFRRADELALAIEARGYRKAGRRTQKQRRPLRWLDYAALTTCVAVCILQFTLLR